MNNSIFSEIPYQVPFKVDCNTLDGAKESELFCFLSSMVEIARNEAISGNIRLFFVRKVVVSMIQGLSYLFSIYS